MGLHIGRKQGERICIYLQNEDGTESRLDLKVIKICGKRAFLDLSGDRSKFRIVRQEIDNSTEENSANIPPIR